MLTTWRISIRGTTDYVMIQAKTPESAIYLAAVLLNRPELDLECDPS